ncbi:MAG TPA: GNAT family N-acetyltransferase [Acidobacteriaceae bacterium]
MIRPGVYLRPAVAADLDAILTLERATQNAPHWSRSAYAAILDAAGADNSDTPGRCLFVAVTDESIVGFAAGMVHPLHGDASTIGEDRISELESVAVAASARRSGLGRALCAAVLEWCKSQGATEVVLEVRASSVGAIGLYSGLGFMQIGERPRYYRDPEDDALVMRLPLSLSGHLTAKR